jgi:hypothetical protein
VLKLSYDEWRKHYTVDITEDAIEDLQRLHKVDAKFEIEKAMQFEYDLYLSKQQKDSK